MGMNILLSGAIGALVAAAVAILFQHISLVEKRRFEVAVATSEYLDELLLLLIKIRTHKEFKFEQDTKAFSTTEYASILDRISILFSSTHVLTRLELVYGNSSEVFFRFENVYGELFSFYRELIGFSKKTWDKSYIENIYEEKLPVFKNSVLDELKQNAKLGSVIRSVIMQLINPILATIGISLLVLASFSALADTTTITGPVTKVVDGDTIYLRQNKKRFKIRLYGIDAPEMKQPYGVKSKLELTKFIDKNDVQCDVKDIDRYKRYVGDCYITISDTRLGLSAFMVNSVHAWVYHKYNDNLDLALFEIKAKENKVGLWATRNPLAPWKWRKIRRK